MCVRQLKKYASQLKSVQWSSQFSRDLLRGSLFGYLHTCQLKIVDENLARGAKTMANVVFGNQSFIHTLKIHTIILVVSGYLCCTDTALVQTAPIAMFT